MRGAATGATTHQKAAQRRRRGNNDPAVRHIQKFGKDNVDAALKSFGAVSKGAQAIAVEAADYAKKSFEQCTATLEKLVGAKTLDKAIEIQTDYLKSAYEGFVAQSTKIGELYAEPRQGRLQALRGSRRRRQRQGREVSREQPSD